MALTTAQKTKVEAKAQAASSKSEGLRILFENDYTVAEAKDVMGVAYGFAYGVAKRAGVIDTAATRRTPKAKAAPAKAKAAPAAKAPRAAKAPAKTATRSKAKA